jgi:hypothetical protein
MARCKIIPHYLNAVLSNAFIDLPKMSNRRIRAVSVKESSSIYFVNKLRYFVNINTYFPQKVIRKRLKIKSFFIKPYSTSLRDASWDPCADIPLRFFYALFRLTRTEKIKYAKTFR